MEKKLHSFTRGHGIWKFNNSSLHDIYVKKSKTNYTTGRDWLTLTKSFQKLCFRMDIIRSKLIRIGIAILMNF